MRYEELISNVFSIEPAACRIPVHCALQTGLSWHWHYFFTKTDYVKESTSIASKLAMTSLSWAQKTALCNVSILPINLSIKALRSFWSLFSNSEWRSKYVNVTAFEMTQSSQVTFRFTGPGGCAAKNGHMDDKIRNICCQSKFCTNGFWVNSDLDSTLLC